MDPSAISTQVNTQVATSLSKIVTVILVPIVELVFLAAIFLFVWGAAGLIIHKDSAEKRTQSGQHILWGLLGMFIMIACYGIVRVIARTIGVTAPF